MIEDIVPCPRCDSKEVLTFTLFCEGCFKFVCKDCGHKYGKYDFADKVDKES